MQSVMNWESSKQWTGNESVNVSSSSTDSCSWSSSTARALWFLLWLRHLIAKWFRFLNFRHVFLNTGHNSLLWVSCCMPQLGQSCVVCVGVAKALTRVPCPSSTSLSWVTAEWHISSVRFSVSAGSLSSLSRVLPSRIPKTKWSRRISSG